MAMVLTLGIAMLAGAVFFAVDAVTLPVRQRRASIERATRLGGDGPRSSIELHSARERLLAPLGQGLGALIVRLAPKGMIDSIAKRLLQAGVAHKVSATTFLAAKVLGGTLGLALGAFAGGSTGTAATALMFGAAFGALLFILPDRLLTSRIKKRRDTIQAELPDALDLLAVSVEAGLGLDGAIAILNENMTGPLADEFALTLGEIRIGEGRQEALKKLSDRLDIPEISALTRAILQSDQLGISLGRILRTQARESRVRRQGAAEERANKLPVKMLFPTILFIFPPLFLVILGPAFITIFQTL